MGRLSALSACSKAGYCPNVASMRSTSALRPRWIVQPIFRADPFHGDKISLKRGLKKRPAKGDSRGLQWFLI
ncbi:MULTISPECIES: hypothetical protein [unclassified Mesorhizobium]|uniref:hypothetical protein n=1 Tax=unclassified Mesorhizobium TaxID=325217 RepID=UPI000F754B72|nr:MULTISPECIES: hypothetical protein [unclassified Mesorhizobium]AZO09279.1 hypothetical protein EJ074_09230 [Mesorhizobium sp. M3A.F.Ca.ET.080.04.2.1]RWB74180.1 MAG: hypothetical protein EOQ49_06990 [Mesorhizobium sp.]RWB88479.1 MAG: hypothetical protein EOQ52_15080 [Mesorhizobium sp.]RWF14371.1 MAG: hypothetical protein EOS64_28545 [Mesorhizobium sp.]